MKRIYTLLATVVIAAMAASCEKEINQPQDQNKEHSSQIVEGGTLFEASLSPVGTKTTIENGTGTERLVKWAAGDAIKVWWASDGSVSATAAAAGASTTFSATVDAADYYYASYPEAAVTALVKDASDDTLKVQVPTVQTGTFAAANIAVAKTTATDKNFVFRNVGSLVRFEVGSSEYTKAVFRGAKGEVLAGTVPVTFTSTGIAVGTVVGAATAVETPLSGAGEYYLAVLPATLSGGFSIALYKGDTPDPAAYKTVEYAVTRSTMLNLGRVDDKIITDYYATVSGSGTKDGKSATNAFGLAELRTLLAQPMDGENQDNGVAYFKASILDGVTIHLADGTYILPEGEDGLKMEFTGYSKPVNVTLQGTTSAILSGNNAYRILVLGNQTNLTLDGLSVKDGNREANASEGAGILIAAGGSGNATLNATGTIFANNKNATSTSGGAIRCAKGTANFTNCTFESNNYARNGASIYTNNDDAVVNCTGCTFKSHSMNTGGAANNSKGAQHYVNCTFDSCYTEGGTGGAIHCNAANAVVTVENCVFDKCRVFVNEIDKGTVSKSTGIISMQKGDVTVTGSTFQNCEGISGAIILLQSDDSGLFKCSDCLFLNNEGKSRGIIQTNGKAVGFFNNCTFYNNKMTTNQYGLILHGGNPSAACFNNCTFYGNNRDQTGGNGVGLNNDGSIILTNSTYIGSDDLVSVRNTNTSSTAVLLANSIVINKSSGKPFISSDKMKCPITSCNSIMGATYDEPAGTYNSTNDIKNATEESLGGSYNTASNAYVWGGPAGTFVKITASGFETALKGITVNNGNKIVNGQLGTGFYNWLNSIGALGKDALGNSRGSSWWPGAYQN